MFELFKCYNKDNIKKTGGEKMNSKELKRFQQKYFKMKFNRLIDEQMILDEDCHQEVVCSLNEILLDIGNGKTVNFTQKSAIKSILLDVFPEMFSLQPDFGSEIYVSLMSYYHFLYTEKVLTKEEYVEMLLFFQTNMFTFFKKLASSSDLNGINFSDMIEELFSNQELFSNHGKNQAKNNVIPMPMMQRAPENMEFTYFQFRIDLEGCKPPFWRRVIVPSNSTFEGLHDVIQVLFDWEDDHLHMFQTKYGEIANEQALLSELPEDHLKKMTYIFDFGDNWSHKLVLEDVLEQEGNLPLQPFCLKVVNGAPIEDSQISDEERPSTLDEINEQLAMLDF